MSKKKNNDDFVDFILGLRDFNLERKKWIGKLCWFWDGKTNDKKNFSILTRFDLMSKYPYRDNVSTFWQHCEPVKPDDDIICNGGNNE